MNVPKNWLENPRTNKIAELLSQNVDSPGYDSWRHDVLAHCETSDDVAVEAVIKEAYDLFNEIPYKELQDMRERSGYKEGLSQLTFARRLLITARDALILSSKTGDIWDDWQGACLLSRYMGQLIDDEGTNHNVRELAEKRAEELADGLPNPPSATTLPVVHDRIREILGFPISENPNSGINPEYYHSGRKDIRRVVSWYAIRAVIAPSDDEIRQITLNGIAVNKNLGSLKDVLLKLPYKPTSF